MLASPAGASAPSVCARQGLSPAPRTIWTEPLDRVVSFRVSDLSLREALDRLAAVAHLRLSYSSEALRLDRIVCVAMDSVPVGDVLTALLESANVEPVAAGGDHVVLTPGSQSLAVESSEPTVVLDRIVVTGSPSGSAWKPLPIALDVLEGGALTGRSANTFAETFNAAVPGLWMWETSGSSLLARYGSIRGTSSFGLSYPKVYIDGIQVANPLLFTRIPPEAVDRIEVIRGPQGAALYGADAISGVTNIVTKQESADAGAPRAHLRSGFGLAASSFGSNPSLGQDHVLSLRAGSNTRSFGLNLEAGGTGAFIPGAYRRQFSGLGTARSVGAQSILTGTLRMYSEAAGAPSSPLLPASLTPTGPGTSTADDGQSVFQFTVGTNLKFAQTDRLAHSLVVGVDGYSLNGVVADDRIPVPSAADAALNAARGGADRFTLHMGSVLKMTRARYATADLSFVGEQSLLYQWTDDKPAANQPSPGPATTNVLDLWRNNTGASAQLNLGFADQLFLTGGVRIERTSDNNRAPTLPMLGASWVLGRGNVNVKLRAAYGKGLRWPETAARETMWRSDHTVPTLSLLDPEEQSGIEGGVDLVVGQVVNVQVTRFDQTATGLIQRVVVSADTSSPGPGGPRKIGYQAQNVGEISNRGWEVQGTLHGGPLSLTGTYSLADSRVQRLALNYTGDLRPGDRMLDVPARTMSATATYSTLAWGASLTAYRAEDWIGYNRLLLAQGLATKSRPPGDFIGPTLRNYWITYPGVTHLRATLTHALRRGLAVTLTGENLLNIQRGEPDNITVLPGRTLTVGFRAEF